METRDEKASPKDGAPPLVRGERRPGFLCVWPNRNVVGLPNGNAKLEGLLRPHATYIQ